MTKNEAMRELQSLGTEQYRKTYQRHGAKGEVFGVSYANLGMLKKRIGINHSLALHLWSSGNHDARVLANMIADPNLMSSKELDRWVAEIDNHMISESMTSMMLRATDAQAHADRWIESPREWICATGWQVFGGLAGAEDREFSTEYLLKRLAQVQNTIQRSANRVRHAMVLALIGIGSRGDKFEEAAVEAACMIGPVRVDHGETNCVTPDPIPYLRRIAAHRSAQRAAAASVPEKKPAPRRARSSGSKKEKAKAPAAMEDGSSAPTSMAKSTPSHEATSTTTSPRKPHHPADSRFAKKARVERGRSGPSGNAPQATSTSRKPATKASAESRASVSGVRKSSKAAKAKAPGSRKAARSASSVRSVSKAKLAGNGKATKKRTAPAKSAKKPSSGGGRANQRAVAGGVRARSKPPARSASGQRVSRGSASPAKRSSGARSAR